MQCSSLPTRNEIGRIEHGKGYHGGLYILFSDHTAFEPKDRRPSQGTKPLALDASIESPLHLSFLWIHPPRRQCIIPLLAHSHTSVTSSEKWVQGDLRPRERPSAT